MLVLALTVTACTSPLFNETWSVVKLGVTGEHNVSEYEIIDVRNCGVLEHKAVDCSAGTSNDLTFAVGGGLSFGEGAKVSIDGGVEASLGIGRNSGESLTLESPPENYVYRYTLLKDFLVKSGDAVARSSSGSEKRVEYVFHARCSMRIEKRESIACSNDDIPQPIPRATQHSNQTVTSHQVTLSPSNNEDGAPILSPTQKESETITVEEDSYWGFVYVTRNGVKRRVLDSKGMGFHEIEVSPDQARIVGVLSGQIHIANTDGSNYRTFQLYGDGSENFSEFRNVGFVSADTVRVFVELGSFFDYSLDSFPLNGSGTYELTFDKFNYLTRVKKL